MAKKIDPRKAKEKKQKIVAAVGGVILLIVLGIQGPTLMKQLSGGPKASAAPARPTTTTPTQTIAGTPTPALPSLAGGQQPSVPDAGASSGSAGGSAPAGVESQLTSFSEFATKDPFAQQLGGTSTTSPSSGASGPSGSSSKPGSGSSSGGGGGGAAPAPGSAVISVNGTLMTVTVGTDFPQPSTSSPGAQPFFHLVSLTAHTATISIAGGSYTNGAQTVTLRENRPVTLVNTADGTRYKLILKPEGTSVPAGPATTTTQTTTTSTGGG